MILQGMLNILPGNMESSTGRSEINLIEGQFHLTCQMTLGNEELENE